MERLIDANALKEVIFSKSESLEDLWDTMGVLNAINNAPTVETHDTVNMYCDKDTQIIVEQIRPQGEWFVNPHSMVMKCMNCGHEETAKDVGVVDKDKHFCYWCGADMRKEESSNG